MADPINRLQVAVRLRPSSGGPWEMSEKFLADGSGAQKNVGWVVISHDLPLSYGAVTITLGEVEFTF